MDRLKGPFNFRTLGSGPDLSPHAAVTSGVSVTPVRLFQETPDSYLNEIPTRAELLPPTRAQVATREEQGRRRDRSRRDADTDNSLAAKIERMQEEIKRLKRADRHDTTPVDPMDKYGDPHPCHKGGRSDGSRIRRRKNGKF
ncbi:potassium-transporting ATPase alpha chain 2 [Corchorus olitorius]|uniref:Potassium-transporting ATPase alpha chain 2 n=1 Tax=Corchorus olitorius TaxID=93759 RepID=A0A1R3HVB1_9ROSI|nr:potassium-transporting ATPase alpha chain 2 [Corchorus olitorius]